MRAQAKRAFAWQTFHRLTELRDKIQMHLDPVISPEYVQDFHMNVSDLDWHLDSKMDTEPRYCDPFPANEFDRLFEREKVMERNLAMGDWPSDADKSSMSRFERAEQLCACLNTCLGAADFPVDLARYGDWAHL